MTTTSEQGGLVSTSFDGPVLAPISFGGASYTINDTDPTTGNVVESEETQAHPPSFEYIADATDTGGSLVNLIEVQGSRVDFTFGSYDQFASDGSLSQAYTLLPGAIAAAPEPSSWALLVLGVGGIGLMLRRARKTLRPSMAGLLRGLTLSSP